MACKVVAGNDELLAIGTSWIDDVCRSDESVRTYGRVFSALARRFRGKQAMLSMTQVDVMQWLDGLRKAGQSDRTVMLYWMVCRSWMSWCVDRGFRGELPAWKKYQIRAMRVDEARVVRGGAAGRRTALTAKEAKKVFKWLQTQSSEKNMAVLLMMVAGLRSCEVKRCCYEHLGIIKIGHYVLTVHGKGNKSRVVEFESVVMRAFYNHCPSDNSDQVGPIFSVSLRTIQRWGKEAWIAAGRGSEGSAHGLRRTAATLLLERGATLEQVQEFLGHVDSKTTLRCYVARKRKLCVTTGIGGRK